MIRVSYDIYNGGYVILSTTSTLLSISGLIVGAYGVYYLYTNGYFEKIANAIKLPAPSGGSDTTTPPAETTPPASKCKAGELEDSKGKCVKCATSLDSKDKCVKAARAQITSRGYVAAYRGWIPMRERITLG